MFVFIIVNECMKIYELFFFIAIILSFQMDLFLEVI